MKNGCFFFASLCHALASAVLNDLRLITCCLPIVSFVQTLRDEGLDPETMEFEIAAGKASVKKVRASTGGKTDEESGSTADAAASSEQNADSTETSQPAEDSKASDEEPAVENGKETEEKEEEEQLNGKATDATQPEESEEKESEAAEEPAQEKVSVEEKKDEFVKVGNGCVKGRGECTAAV